MSDVNTDTGVILEALNDKADRDLNNVSAGIDFVVESYQNGTEWYRLYKSGWIEQGGRKNHTSSDTTQTVNLLKAYKDTNYTVIRTTKFSGTIDCYPVYSTGVITMNTGSFTIATEGRSDWVSIWYACGYIN